MERRKVKRNLLRENEVRARVGNFSRVTFWRWERDGVFPKRIKIGPRAVVWYEDEIDDFIESRGDTNGAGK